MERRTFLRTGATALVLAPALPAEAIVHERGRESRDSRPTLGLQQGLLELAAPRFELALVGASQTLAALKPRGADGFDFVPSDWLAKRAADGFFHVGDLNLRLRTAGAAEWRDYSTAAARQPVAALPVTAPVLASADLAATLPPDMPLDVRRDWEVDGEDLAVHFELRNGTDEPVEIGALGFPMIFNNILTDRSLDEAHAVASFSDPYIGEDAGYLQVTRLNGHGPALVVVPLERGRTPFEAYRPLLDDPTSRGITFEGFYEWMAHSKAYAENEWRNAEPWNPATSTTLAPGESRSYGVRFLLADSIRGIEETLVAHGCPVAVGIPGYVLPKDQEAQLFLRYPQAVRSVEIDGPGALEIRAGNTTPNGWRSYRVQGGEWGRVRLTITYADELRQSIHYNVIEPAQQAVAGLSSFLLAEQWFEDPDDPFGRSPSIISYDYGEKRQVTEENRAWIAGLSDEGGAGSWLAAVMAQLIRPDPQQIAMLERFVDGVLWGGIQYADGDTIHGVRKSMFYYEPDQMPEGTYSADVDYGGWSSWDREEAMSVDRSYDYPHVAAAYWVLYRLARTHQGLVTHHPYEWYLERAYRTSQAMAEYAAHYAQFGQMEGTVFVEILRDLQREGWTEQAAALEATMRERAELWRSLGFPFGSEMPWDSTGQEEVYAWCRYFGFDDKALVTLNAILGYMPTVPHWGYNGSARRYWDFLYAGKLRRIERQLHHYGSGLNAIPVLNAYRENPDDVYLLRVGYGGLLGSIANITRDGFGACAFHAFPSTLRIDGYSGDYGSNFFGHALHTATYVLHHPELGWLAFGGNLSVEESGGKAAARAAPTEAAIALAVEATTAPAPTTGATRAAAKLADASTAAANAAAAPRIRVEPRDAARSRVYLAPLGLWLTLDAGTFQSVALATGEVRITLGPATAATPQAFLRIEQPAYPQGAVEYTPVQNYPIERGARVIPLADGPSEVVLRAEG